MRRATLCILALLAAVQGAAILIWDRGSDQLAERERLVVPGLERDRIRGIAILRREDPVELELLEGQGWRITRPLRARADAGAVEAILSAVEFLEIQRAVPSGVSLKQLGLEPPAIRIRLSGARTTELHLGALDPSRHGLYLAVSGRALVVSASLLEVVDRDLDSLRDRELSPLRASEIERARIRNPGGPELLLERAGEGRGFLVSSGGVQTRMRDQRALQITAALASLRATRFPRGAGSARSELLIAASGSGARAKRIAIELLGGCPGHERDRLLRVAGVDPAPVLACVETADLAPLVGAAPPGGLEELRDLRLTDLDEPSLRGIRIQSRTANLALLRDGVRWRIQNDGSEPIDGDDGAIRAWVASLRGVTTRLEAADPARVASLGFGAGRILLTRDGAGGSDTIRARCAAARGRATGPDRGPERRCAPGRGRRARALRGRSSALPEPPGARVFPPHGGRDLRESGAAREELKRDPEGGFGSVASARTVDQDRVHGLLDRLAKLEAVRYAARGDRLAAPSVVWRLRLEAPAADAGPKAGRAVQLEVGPELQGGGCLARTPGAPLFVLGATDCALLRQSLSSP